jgi:hypothetical protein
MGKKNARDAAIRQRHQRPRERAFMDARNDLPGRM